MALSSRLVRVLHACVITLLLNLTSNPTNAFAATCKSIAQVIFPSAPTPQQLRADLPAGATLVARDLYTRNLTGATKWWHCAYMPPQQQCGAVGFREFKEVKDALEGSTTYVITAGPVQNVQGGISSSLLTAARLEVTYTWPKQTCVSQATLYVLSGAVGEFRIFAPPAATTGILRDWVRFYSDAENRPWTLCDDGYGNPGQNAVRDACFKHEVFRFTVSSETDSFDHAPGVRVICSAKPDNQWVQGVRECRAALSYNPARAELTKPGTIADTTIALNTP